MSEEYDPKVTPLHGRGKRAPGGGFRVDQDGNVVDGVSVTTEDWVEEDIPQRPWIVPGYILRGAVTILAGEGGVGKSSLAVAWASAAVLHLEWGEFKPNCAARVMFYSVEDDEQKRRFSAILRQLGAFPRDLKGKLMRLWPDDVGLLIHYDKSTNEFSFTQTLEAIERQIKDFKPDILILDPFGELHDADVSDNTAIRIIAAKLRSLARQYECGIVLIGSSASNTTSTTTNVLPPASRGSRRATIDWMPPRSTRSSMLLLRASKGMPTAISSATIGDRLLSSWCASAYIAKKHRKAR